MAPLKAITFLGTGRYEEITYTSSRGTCRTSYFQEALVRLYIPQTLLVVLTPQARKKHWEPLQKVLAPLPVEVVPVDAPDPQGEADLWVLFNQLVKHVDQGERLLFDITHAFRYLPLLALLATAYLRTVRGVDVEDIVYGMFTQGSPEAPIVSLRGGLELLDWMMATEQFRASGTAAPLVALLRQSPSPELRGLTTTLEEISDGLHVLRPEQVRLAAARLPAAVDSVRQSATDDAPPLVPLLERLEEEYGRLGLPDADAWERDPRGVLRGQLRLIEWYVEKDQILHAFGLAREWLPNLLCFRFERDPLMEEARREMEVLLEGGKAAGADTTSPLNEQYRQFQDAKRLRALWGGDPRFNLAKARNDLMHAGFRSNPRPPSELRERLQGVLRELQEIARASGIWP